LNKNNDKKSNKAAVGEISKSINNNDININDSENASTNINANANNGNNISNGNAGRINLEKLVEFQLLEREILKKAVEINNLKKNEKLSKLKLNYEEINKAYEDILNQFNSLEHERKKIEGTISLNNEKIKKNEEKLFSGTITSSKELVNYQEEIKHLKEVNDGLESKELEIMFSIDEIKPKLQDLQQKRKTVSDEVEKLSQEIYQKIKVLEDKIAQLKELRLITGKEIPADILSVYSELKQKKGGVALAIMNNDICDVCNMELPVSDLAKIKKSQKNNNQLLNKCPNCGRLLILNSDEIEMVKEKVKKLAEI